MKELRYQQKAVDELVSKTIDLMGLKGSRNALIFKSPTGSGKTVMASEMLGRLRAPGCPVYPGCLYLDCSQ